MALAGLPHDEVAHVYHVAQLAYLARRLGAFEELFGLLIKYVEAVPGAVEAQIGAYNSNVGPHYLVHLADALGNQHHLLGVRCALVVPLRHILTQLDVADGLAGMARRGVGIDHRLDK